MSGRTRIAAMTLIGLVGFCLLWPSLGPYDANHVDFSLSRQGPSLAHPLGTDQFGRDLVTRLAAGGRVSLAISAAALSIILGIGFLYGAVSGLAGGRTDGFLMRILDGLLALPRLPVSIVVLVVLDQKAQTVWAVVFALSVVSWMLTARLVRGHVLVSARASTSGPRGRSERGGSGSSSAICCRTRSASSSSPCCSSCRA